MTKKKKEKKVEGEHASTVRVAKGALSNDNDLCFRVREIGIVGTFKRGDGENKRSDGGPFSVLQTIESLRRAHGSYLWKYVAAEITYSSPRPRLLLVSGASRWTLMRWWDSVVCARPEYDEAKEDVCEQPSDRRRLRVLNSNLDLLVGTVDGKLSTVERLVRSVLFQVLSGLVEIRERCGCAHGYLLSESILLDPSSPIGHPNAIPRLRLEGFGVHLLAKASPLGLTEDIDLVAPEYVVAHDTTGRTCAGDMWSCGAIACKLLGYRSSGSTASGHTKSKRALTTCVRRYCAALKRVVQRRRKSSLDRRAENADDARSNEVADSMSPSMAALWLDEDLRRAISPKLTGIITNMLRVHEDARSSASEVLNEDYFSRAASEFSDVDVGESEIVVDTSESKELLVDPVRTPVAQIKMKSPARTVLRSKSSRAIETQKETPGATRTVVAASAEDESGDIERASATPGRHLRYTALEDVSGCARFLAAVRGDPLALFCHSELGADSGAAAAWDAIYDLWLEHRETRGRKSEASRERIVGSSNSDRGRKLWRRFEDPSRSLLESADTPMNFASDASFANRPWTISLARFRQRCFDIVADQRRKVVSRRNARCDSIQKTDESARLSSALKLIASVRRALAALPWSRPRVIAACGGAVASEGRVQSQRQVVVPPSLRAQVWAALLGVTSVDPSMTDGSSASLSYASSRMYYASLVERARSIVAIDSSASAYCDSLRTVARQVGKDTRRCHQYIYRAQSPSMRLAVTRIIQAWIVDDLPDRRGYWQGLSSVCMTFLLLYNMDEPTAFSTFSAFVSRYLLNHDRISSDRTSSNDDKATSVEQEISNTKSGGSHRTPVRSAGGRDEDGDVDVEKVASRGSRNMWWAVQDRTLKRQLRSVAQIVGFHDAELGARLEIVGLQPDMFGLRWLLSTFAHVLPFRSLLLLWDAILVREDPSFVLFVTAAFLLVRRGRYVGSDARSGTQPSLSTLMRQLTSMAGPKLTLVRRTLRIANRLVVSTPALDQRRRRQSNEAEETMSENPPPSCWTSPLRPTFESATRSGVSVAVFVGRSEPLSVGFDRAFSRSKDIELFRMSLESNEMQRCDTLRSSTHSDVDARKSAAREALKVQMKLEHLAEYLCDQQNACLRSATRSENGARVTPIVALVPVVGGADAKRDAKIAIEREHVDGAQVSACALSLGRWLIRAGVNCVVVTDGVETLASQCPMPDVPSAALVAMT
eukprot:g2283.t1